MNIRALVILFLLVIDVAPMIAQTFSDGPMNLKVRVRFVYIDDYYDVFGGNQEPRWVVKVRDDSALRIHLIAVVRNSPVA